MNSAGSRAAVSCPAAAIASRFATTPPSSALRVPDSRASDAAAWRSSPRSVAYSAAVIAPERRSVISTCAGVFGFAFAVVATAVTARRAWVIEPADSNPSGAAGR